ncbi:translation initiation factor 2 [Desulfitobacterium sp.]|uniref:translation initiation factor 2 n=1 Tax=Desulfitobacterium sp. TaxID=49981 RepID=UPI002C5D06E4|nr:translation initiation factor 2 [Desulfitobacterium sp.]HVJ50505.1 translation initiation factor 2 [Desulfitobacterium sp.]
MKVPGVYGLNSQDELKNLREELRVTKFRVNELEQRIEHLRVSRRVLMNLLEKVEREKVTLVHKLEKENVRLQRDNTRFAKWIFSKNRKIMELQEEIEK